MQSLHVAIALFHRGEAKAEPQIERSKQAGGGAPSVGIRGYRLDLIEQAHRGRDFVFWVFLDRLLSLLLEYLELSAGGGQFRFHGFVFSLQLFSQGIILLAQNAPAGNGQITFQLSNRVLQLPHQNILTIGFIRRASGVGALPKEPFEFRSLAELLDMLMKGPEHEPQGSIRVHLVVTARVAPRFEITAAGQHAALAATARIHRPPAVVRHVNSAAG